MRVFAISDLHLSFEKKVHLDDLPSASDYKSMDLFSLEWHRHFEKITANWRRIVLADDIVLLPGDLSWAMKPEEAVVDLDFVGQLPGVKVLLKGNHDYWWQAIGKVRHLLPAGVVALQNDFFAAGPLAVCGTRGWLCPGERAMVMSAHDEKVYRRELQRLELSLASAARAGYREIIVMLHYPPAVEGEADPGFLELMQKYGVKTCIYGHLHNADSHRLLTEAGGISFYLVACDYIDFCPRLIIPYPVDNTVNEE